MNAPRLEDELTLRRFVLPGLFVLALFWTLWARRPEPPQPPPSETVAPVEELWELGGPIFGTTWSAKLFPGGSPEHSPAQLQGLIQERLSAVDLAMSTYKAQSELSQLNASPVSGEPQMLSGELASVLQAALDVQARSKGAFDPTVGPLVNAWGFGPEGVKEPSLSELQAARERVGSDKLMLATSKGRTKEAVLIRTQPDVFIDLSAIAKGYGVDVVSDLITELGYERSLVEVGGEIRARGMGRQGAPWRVGIERPQEGPPEVEVVVPLSSRSMATSGNYRNFRMDDGRKVTHIIDPRRGSPVEHGLGSVSVLADTCMEADAWATALYVLGAEEGLKLADQEGIAALFLTPEGTGGILKSSSSQSFPTLPSSP